MPISASNFRSNSLSGTVSVINGFANISLATVPYALEGNKSFVIKLRNGSVTGEVIATSPTITLQDTSSVVSLTSNVSSINEGQAVTFTLTTANAVNGSNVYYTSNINLPDFIGANTGIITINNNTGSFTFNSNADSITEGVESFRVDIRTSNIAGNIVYSSNTITIQDTSNAEISASGGNDTFTFAGYKYHVFLSSNNFVVSNPSSNITVDYMLIAGGGGGAVGYNPNGQPGSGGGAGGLLMGNISISGTSNIIVGGGGSAAPARNITGGQGVNTSIFSAVAFGGGGGAYTTGYLQFGNPGGSGSGAGIDHPTGASGGLAIGSPAVDVAGAQGYPGGSIFGSNPTGISSSGGGGAGGAGLSFTGADNGPRNGGIGLVPPWLGMPSSYGTPGPGPGRYFAGGGGGSTAENTGKRGDGGAGGGGRGARSEPNQLIPSTNANAYTGGGGGGGSSPTFLGGAGGSGIAILRYPVTVAGTSSVDYLLVAGGGGGGGPQGGLGGGGAGGLIYTSNYPVTPGNTITVTIGAGGIGATSSTLVGGAGGNSTISAGTTITAVGGGQGGAAFSPVPQYPLSAGYPGGSGGGGSTVNEFGKAGGSGYGYPSPAQQGYPGGSSNPAPTGYGSNGAGGGGGGAGGTGANATPSKNGDGGIGASYSISGTSTYYAGGGGGGGSVATTPGDNGPQGKGGLGGGGPGGYGQYPSDTTNQGGTAANVNTGGGGGGARGNGPPGSLGIGGSGGSGVAIFRHPGAYRTATTSANVTVSSDGSNVIYTFTGSGTITF